MVLKHFCRNYKFHVYSKQGEVCNHHRKFASRVSRYTDTIYLLGSPPNTPTQFLKGADMQEKKYGVKRLLQAIEQNIDDSNIGTLAKLLNYHEPQLKEDIEAIKLVEIINKEND